MANDRYSKPDWFDIKKYEREKPLDAQEWYYQLIYRYSIIHFYNNEEVQKKAFEEIKEYGIMPLPTPSEDSKHTVFLLEEVQKFIRQRSSAVEFLSRAEAYKFCSILELEENKQEKSLNDRFGVKKLSLNEQLDSLRDNCLFDSDEELKKFINEPFDLFIKDKKIDVSHSYNAYINDNICHVTVNLDASDKKIKKDFNEWLERARKEFISHEDEKDDGLNGFRKGYFEKIHKLYDYRILPYIDLQLEATLGGKEEIAAADIIRILYPEEVTSNKKTLTNQEAVNKLRKKIPDTVKKYSNLFMREDTLSKLSAYCKFK